MIITITNKDGLNQISKFSENKIKHITETNQWGYVINTILKNSNKQDMKQTVVEWLLDELNQIKSSSTDMNGTIKFLETEFKELFEQAKEMESQQQCYSEEEFPTNLESVLAKITHQNDLGLSQWYEVVYYDDNKWCSYSGSKTFQDGERVIEWKYCKDCL